MKLHCPFCTDEITPDTTKCPSCSTVYGSDTLELLEIYVKRAIQKDHVEQRKQFRVPITLKVTYSTQKAFKENYLTNLSIGGIFIRTDSPLDEGEKLRLKIFLPDEKEEMNVLCEVVWKRLKEGDKITAKYPPGMGVRFLDISPKDRKRIINTILRSASS